jgi:hypothetical protein
VKSEDFDKLVEERITKIRALLLKKRAEYAAGGRDRLSNFNRAPSMLEKTRETSLVGMWVKHIVSILDIVDDFPGVVPSEEMLNEKISDAINYLILLEACFIEDIARVNDQKKSQVIGVLSDSGSAVMR